MVRNGTGRSQLSRQAVDETLAALTADHQRIAAALYAMDTHPAHRLLSAAPTAGRTALAWAQIRSRMGEVWADFTAFGIALDAARAAGPGWAASTWAGSPSCCPGRWSRSPPRPRRCRCRWRPGTWSTAA
ncbi:hypothetical protein GCM10009558_109650 [Virgisporangium aurantiacum]